MRAVKSVLRQCVVAALAMAGATAFAAPNVVLVVLDDMSAVDINTMPKTTAYLRPTGVEFSNAYVTNSLCAPSRATLLTGKYTHNTGVPTNDPPTGGWEPFYRSGNEAQTISTWLAARGYYTGFVGKYLNGYGESKAVPSTYVPPGWTEWYGVYRVNNYYNYQLVENGVRRAYGTAPQDYMTDVLSQQASRVMTNAFSTGRPLFLVVAPTAPHKTIGALSTDTYFDLATPAPRHSAWLEGVSPPRPHSFNEPDVSDKPWGLRSFPLLTPEDLQYMDRLYRTRIQSLQAVDDMVASLIEQLRAASQLQNTYIIFTSDNGFFYGEHRYLRGKGTLYDPSNRVPMLVAGPGVVAGLRRQELVLNTDLFPTIADMAGVDKPAAVDGRSFKSLLQTRARSVAGARKSFLMYTMESMPRAGLRLPSYSYVERYWNDGSISYVELYDQQVDPGETMNLAPRLTAESAARLHAAVMSLRSCTGASCRSLEDSIDDSWVQWATPVSAPVPGH